MCAWVFFFSAQTECHTKLKLYSQREKVARFEIWSERRGEIFESDTKTGNIKPTSAHLSVSVYHNEICGQAGLQCSHEVNKSGRVCIWQEVSASPLHLRADSSAAGWSWSVTIYELCSRGAGIRGDVGVKQRSPGALNSSSFIWYALRLHTC